MGRHIVEVVEDGALNGEGWAMVRTDAGDLFFIVEESAAPDPRVLTEAWEAARRLESDVAAMREAVIRGHQSGPAA